MPVRVLIAGGGTGGHVIPALAIARELTRGGAEVIFAGTSRGLESRLVPHAGYPLELISSGQWKNVSFAKRLRTVFAVPMGVVECLRLLKRQQIDVVLGVGGYASGPALMAARLAGVPAMVFEPNATPGLTNRIAGRWVQAAAVHFPQAVGYFRNAEMMGIPVREEFFALAARTGSGPLRLLVFGGSQGARILNDAMPKVARRLLEAVPGLTIVHQTGAGRLDATLDAYDAAGTDMSRVMAVEFLDDMPAQFGAADLVLSRSGASTVAELAAAGKPAVLVPFAAATDEHQRRNAESFASGGAAEVILEADFSPERLSEALRKLLESPEKLKQMAAAARAQSHPGAAAKIAARAEQLARARG
jgi:UDP-N-acetylglucosamine--N-acetylmuramyl-(pentapeptide) pyrophosphoryl-undecaprenol N-acetylglucosamine transferase